MTDSRNGTLVDYFGVYGPSRFKDRTGRPLSVRGLQRKARQFDLPIIDIGRGKLIDPNEGDKRLSEFAHRPADRARRTPGRPPKVAKAAGVVA
jgi:hypothetical protein